MPTCKQCHSRISKFDKDVCPVCGCKNPIEEGKSDTIEITSQIRINQEDFRDYHPKKRSVVFLLFFLGFFGAPYFYLHQFKRAILMCFIELGLIAGMGSLLAFLTTLGFLYGYLIPAAILLLINLSIGLIYLFKNSIKDGYGEFII